MHYSQLAYCNQYLMSDEVFDCQLQISARETHDHSTFWILTGIAIRIAQRIGLHLNVGADTSMSLFEAEMRCRLLMQIKILDARAAEMASTALQGVPDVFEMRPPRNVNDSELYPSMKVFPVEYTGPTEMVFVLVRYEIGRFIRSGMSSPIGTFDSGWAKLSSGEVSLAQTDRLLDEFGNHMEQSILKKLDLSIPLHLLAGSVVKVSLWIMRLRAHHPRRYADKGVNMPQNEKDMLFDISCSSIEHYNLILSTESMQGFVWHISNAFQWFELSMMRQRLS